MEKVSAVKNNIKLGHSGLRDLMTGYLFNKIYSSCALIYVKNRIKVSEMC